MPNNGVQPTLAAALACLLARLTPNFEVQALVRKYNNVVTEMQITMSAIEP